MSQIESRVTNDVRSYLMLVMYIHIWDNTKACTKILVCKVFCITNTITKLLHYVNTMFPAYYAACMTTFPAYYVTYIQLQNVNFFVHYLRYICR